MMDVMIIFLSLLPALIYSFIIYLTVPYKTINIKEAIPYIAIGFLSVGILKYVWFFYPEWKDLALNLVGSPKENPFEFFHVYYFIQIAFLEELSKLAIFLMYEFYRRRLGEVKSHPIATMFYVGMISLGFSVIENIQYGTYSATPIDTLWWRSITAVVAHMVFGLFMGYWISMGRIGAKFNDRSLFDIVINKRKGLRTVLYTIIGLISATILHGVYDLHLEINGAAGITGIYILLIGSLLGVYWCFKNLRKLYSKKLKELRKKVDL